MPGAARRAVPRQRDVDRFLDQDPRVALGQQHGLAFGKRGSNGCSGLAHPASGIGFGLRRQCADLAVGERKWGPVAGVRQPQLLQLVEIRGPAIAARASSRNRSTSSACNGLTSTGS